MFLSKSIRTLLIALVALALTGFTYAYAAANTVPGSKAGDGQGAITGYAVSNIHYNLNATDPTKIDGVTFTLDAAATTVKIRIDAGTWYNCTVAGMNATCATTTGTQPTVAPAAMLQVIATN